MSAPKYLTGDAAAINEFLDKFDTFLIDCDGVLWSGAHVFEGIPETIALLHSKGKRTVFVTNNSTISREQYVTKLTGKGIPCEVDDICGSAYSSAIYISRILKPARKKVFILGESGIEAELASEGVPYVGGTDPALRRLGMTTEDFNSIADGSALDPEVGVVLAGLDFHITYLKLAHAHAYLQGTHDRKNHEKAIFLATNLDHTLPQSNSFFPGAGSATVAAVATMIDQQPVASLGKPSQGMLDAVDGKFHLDRSRTCMVGDRLNTDILFGVQGRLGGTLAVLTGVLKKSDWEQPDTPSVPSHYVDVLSDLLGPVKK